MRLSVNNTEISGTTLRRLTSPIHKRFSINGTLSGDQDNDIKPEGTLGSLTLCRGQSVASPHFYDIDLSDRVSRGKPNDELTSRISGIEDLSCDVVKTTFYRWVDVIGERSVLRFSSTAVFKSKYSGHSWRMNVHEVIGVKTYSIHGWNNEVQPTVHHHHGKMTSGIEEIGHTQYFFITHTFERVKPNVRAKIWVVLCYALEYTIVSEPRHNGTTSSETARECEQRR